MEAETTRCQNKLITKLRNQTKKIINKKVSRVNRENFSSSLHKTLRIKKCFFFCPFWINRNPKYVVYGISASIIENYLVDRLIREENLNYFSTKCCTGIEENFYRYLPIGCVRLDWWCSRVQFFELKWCSSLVYGYLFLFAELSV